MKTATSPLHAALLKKFHTICSVAGISKDQKSVLLASYGVESSKDLTEKQLSDIINTLNREPDMWRKRCMAAVSGWLMQLNKEQNAKYIIGIICQSCQADDFNRIPVSRLRDVYYEFVRKTKTAARSQAVKSSILNDLICKN